MGTSANIDDVLVGLDIGTTKTCAVIGFANENGQVQVAGVGIAPSKGLKKRRHYQYR